MNKKEKQRFGEIYERRLNLMKLQGMQPKTIEAYARVVRREMMYFDCVPDKLTVEQLEDYFVELAATITQYYDALIAKYGDSLLPSHRKTFHSICRCRTPAAGEVYIIIRKYILE